MHTSHSFLQYFRCREEHGRFEPRGKSCGAPGFFRFGSDVIGYGQVSVGSAAPDISDELFDVASEVVLSDGACLMPFDVEAAVDNLRRERYELEDPSGGGATVHNGMVRKAYYLIRPLLPVSVRKHLQRMSLKGWDKKPFPSWPVDRSVDRLFEQLMILTLKTQQADKIPFIWFWPEGKSGCAIMTHDVETGAGLNFCSALMDLNDSYGIKSSFQVIPGGRYQAKQSIRDEMQQRGFEVNLHDWNHDGHLYSDRKLFLSRAAKINQAAIDFQAQGFRSAVLYRNTDWYDVFRFSYDMSVPNVGHLDPQPGGCCTVMPYFIGQILEIPLTTTQDYPLFHILRDYSIDLWRRQMRLILNGNGLISCVVHPDYVIEPRARATYLQLLAHLASLRSERNVWLALPREVNRWWRERSQMKLIQENGRWEIAGPGKERARIAYAAMDGERLIYTVDQVEHAREEVTL